MSETIITSNLENTFQALKNSPANISQPSSPKPEYTKIPYRNHAPISSVNTQWGNGMAKFASGSGIMYGQPQFFSPVHTPINWQIPSKRIEQSQWARFFYTSEPKVASAIDFYASYPMSDWTHECKDIKVKNYFDRMKTRLHLNKWMRLMSHEIHLLGDCFPLLEISCPHCQGTGRVGDEMCDHEGGTVGRIVILNPDYVDVHQSPLSPEPIIVLRPDESLINMIQKKLPGYERLSPQVVKLIAAGQPIRLDNRSVGHLMYGESPYGAYGTGMVRRLFPVLSYKTKLMVAQWIVAERLIIPIKIVKVGSDDRPAGPADIAAVQEQLMQTANDPTMTIVTHHNFELDFFGASGKVLTLSNEFEFINQEILDGLMINNALLNGEGPAYGAAAVGIEAMIQRLETFRNQMSEWLIDFVYRPEAKRQGFIDEDSDSDDEEYIVPNIKWDKMHLRDQQQDKQFALQLYEKGLLSAQTMLEIFGYDPDMEIERKRYDYVQMMALGQGFGGQQGGGAGGGGGGGMGGGMPSGDLGGMGGGGGDGGGLGAPPIEAAGGAPAAPAGGAPVAASNGINMVKTAQAIPGMPQGMQQTPQVQIADPNQFGGRVLREKTREKVTRDQQKATSNQKHLDDKTVVQTGPSRDEKGRIMFTKPEIELVKLITKCQQDGILKYGVQPQYPVKIGGQEYLIDFAIPQLRLGIEADGEMFHSAPAQLKRDKERDMVLTQAGWTIIRFKDTEIEKKGQMVVGTIMKNVAQKEQLLKKFLGKEYGDDGKDKKKDLQGKE